MAESVGIVDWGQSLVDAQWGAGHADAAGPGWNIDLGVRGSCADAVGVHSDRSGDQAVELAAEQAVAMATGSVAEGPGTRCAGHPPGDRGSSERLERVETGQGPLDVVGTK